MTALRSIQGEQQRTTAVSYAAMEDVDAYVDAADEYVLTCRERGRHLWPSIKRAGMRFIDVTDEGLLVRLLLCECCQLAQRVELWDVRHSRGRVTRCEPVSATVQYLTGPDGQRYTAPAGRGRMTPKQVRNSLASTALKGQNFTMLRKAATATKED